MNVYAVFWGVGGAKRRVKHRKYIKVSEKPCCPGNIYHTEVGVKHGVGNSSSEKKTN